MTAVDFTAWRHPVRAVACPDCKQPAGAMCERPSGHGASDFHAARKAEADRVFIKQHGEDAWIERTPAGWTIHPAGRAKEQRQDKPRTELTAAGEQYVMAGCERQEPRQGAQLDLWR